MESKYDITRSTAVYSLGFHNFHGPDSEVNGFTFPDGETPPTETEIQAEMSRLEAAYPLQELREKRSQSLVESDWIGLSDTALTNEKAAEWKLYRQKLRDLPDGLDTVEKVKAVTWPTKPE